ncbi:MAG: helix-turn-helix transcriptional regulator [Deltaproteobacteria bacterium]|nr:helix-turn-helix transcriptional regulator [Deltaproteobacteria bacterium]
MANRENKEIGLRIKKVRTALGISQMKLADAVGVSFQQIQKYESGANKVSIEKLKRIAAILNAPLLYLIGVEKKRGKEDIIAEKGARYGQIGLEDLSAEEIHLLLQFRSIKNDSAKEGIVLLLKGLEQSEKRK